MLLQAKTWYNYRMDVSICNTSVKAKCSTCRPLGGCSAPADPLGFNLVVYVTNSCNATCEFCCNTSNKPFLFDLQAFKETFDHIIAKVTIKSVMFTGGEPTLNIKAINACVDYISSKVSTQITVLTNGTRLHLLTNPGISNISLSQHAWTHSLNEQILGISLPADYVIKSPLRHKINFSCNIIKGFVDDQVKMRLVLEHAITSGIGVVGFIGLMPLNPYSTEHRLPIPVISGADVLPYTGWDYPTENGNCCECRNYMYSSKSGKLLPFYTRHNLLPSYNGGGRIIYKQNQIQAWW